MRDNARKLISLDIDGTLEMGDPRGPVTASLVHYARSQGCIIGSASDRTLREQRAIWAKAGLEVDFVSAKQDLHRVREVHPCRRYIHVGDTPVDAHFAKQARFEFVLVHNLEWLPHPCEVAETVALQFEKILGCAERRTCSENTLQKFQAAFRQVNLCLYEAYSGGISLPGLRMPLGSRARLIAQRTSIPSGDFSALIQGR